MITAYLSLGSNVGDREAYLESAIKEINQLPYVSLLSTSQVYETEPESGNENEPIFLNQCCAVETALPPEELFYLLMEIEKKLGRESKSDRKPRTMDIDIVLYGSDVVLNDDLTIPHPLMHQRLFILMPLADIAPNVVHPILGKTMSELLEEIVE